MTDSGRLGSIGLDRMKGLTKEFGGVFHAHLARLAKQHGIAVHRDKETGSAVFSDVPRPLCREFSRRNLDAEAAAQEFAKSQGLDWNELSPKRQIELLHKYGIEGRRQSKYAQMPDAEKFEGWQRRAEGKGIEYRSVIRPKRAVTEMLSPERRYQIAYEATER